jgi:hypothetical protein
VTVSTFGLRSAGSAGETSSASRPRRSQPPRVAPGFGRLGIADLVLHRSSHLGLGYATEASRTQAGNRLFKALQLDPGRWLVFSRVT